MQEEVEDTKRYTRIRKSKDRKHNVQRSTKHTHTTKDRVTRTPLFSVFAGQK